MPSARTRKLQAWLEEQIASLAPGAQLPTDKQLAEKFGISAITVGRLVSDFKAQGKVERVPGKGTFIPGGEIPTNDEGLTRRTAAERLAETIYQLICKGDLRMGAALPSVKFTCLQFNVSSQTVTTAYRILQKRKIVQKIGKTFWIGQFEKLIKKTKGRDIFLFKHKSTDFADVFRKDHLSYAYQKMEREIQNHGHTLRFESTEELPHLFNKWRRDGRLPQGVVFVGMRDDTLPETLPWLKKFCSPRSSSAQTGGRPGILVDWLGGSGFEQLPRAAHILSRGNLETATSRTMARHLLENGFKEAVLCINEANRPHTGIWAVEKIAIELMGRSPSFKLHQVIEPDPAFNDDEGFIKRMFSYNMTFLMAKFSNVNEHSLKREMTITHDIFEACTKFPKATIWVCANDSHAALLHAKATEKGMRIPRDIQIVTLENDPRYYHLGLSSCTPDLDKIGYLMAHILIGDVQPEKTTKEFLRVTCDVINKLTTRIQP